MNRDLTPGTTAARRDGLPTATPDPFAEAVLGEADLARAITGLVDAPMSTLLVVGDPAGPDHARDPGPDATARATIAALAAPAGLLTAPAPAADPATGPDRGPAVDPRPGPAPADPGPVPRRRGRRTVSRAPALGSPDLLAQPGPELELAPGGRALPMLAEPQFGEPVLLSALAVAGALTCWACGAPLSSWLSTVALVPLSAWAVRPGGFGGGPVCVAVRALLVLLGALVTGLLVPGLSGLAVVWVLAVSALYPVLLPRQAGTAITSLGVLSLCVPVAVTLFHGDVQAAQDPTTLAGTVAAAAVAAGLGGAAAYVRGALSDAALLAEQRRALARTAREELVRVVSSDGLTSLPNRSTLLGRTAQAMSRTDVIGGQLAMFVLDVDRFTAVTDTLGPSAGDEVLRQVARRLRAAMPAEDVVARIGTHRFAVLVEGVGPEGCTGMARRMAALLEEPITGVGRTVTVTCSIGIAVATPELSAPAELLRAAEEAVTAAARNGRARWATYDQAMHAHARSRGTLEIELREAIRAGRVGAAYQPVLTLGRDGSPDRVAGVELVARWTREDGTAVPSLRFLPVAEELGLAAELGGQLLDQGLAALRRWREHGIRIGAVSVDVSTAELDDPDFARGVAERLQRHRMHPNRMVVEVCAARFVDTEQSRNTLAMLRSLGVGVVVDGFGRTGMSVVALRQLPVTAVKLDRTLTTDLGCDDTLTATMVSLCRSLGLRCILDGIESQAQLDAARRLGADAVQGPLIARPVLTDDVPALLLRR